MDTNDTFRFSILGPAAPIGETFTLKSEMFRDIKESPLWHGTSPVVPVEPNGMPDGYIFWVPKQKPDESTGDWLRRCGVIKNVGTPEA